MKLDYLAGFQNTHQTEAKKGALPKNQNSPQKTPMGLYPEQFSTSSFTAPRGENLKSWLYRIRPSVVHGEYKSYDKNKNFVTHRTDLTTSPNQLRWGPQKKTKSGIDFVDGITTFCEGGSSSSGLAIHLFQISADMEKRFIKNSDGEMLIVVQAGELLIKTEFGHLHAKPLEIVVIPRGVVFQVLIQSDSAAGYICENFGKPFRIPELGPIGANGLANPRHFLAPVAQFEEEDGKFELLNKFDGQLWTCKLGHNPLDVVAWWGNTYPYKYDLSLFNTINTVSFDHPDPSIFTVLTSPSAEPGVANIDFAIFPPRWMVAENTFRPPYYHRNVMSEFMGLILGEYDAKAEGFLPGGASLHNMMSAHGPDLETFENATKAELKPHKIDKTMAFMFESRYLLKTTPAAMKSPTLQKDYLDCWKGIKPAKVR